MIRRAFLLVMAVGLALTAGSPVAASPQPTYLNPRASVSARVEDLMERMTLPEKVGQMDQIVVEKLRGDCRDNGQNGPLVPSCEQDVLITNHTGSILAGATDNPQDDTGRGWAEQYNAIQRFAIDNSRLHIPIIYGADAVHGFGHPFDATLFPHSFGMGATWDPALAEAVGASTRRQLLASGVQWNFAPVQDLARDTRWGRYYETWAEAPVLAASMGAADVRGMQGGGFDSPRLAATVKHFAGYSQSINGHDRVEAQLPVRYLQDTLLPAYSGGIDAGSATVMVDSGSVNGIPATASRFLLTEELRRRLGFQGVVISDFGDVPALASAYHIVPDLAGAVAAAVNAGVDMAMEPFDAAGFDNALLQDVQRGVVSEARVDQSVRRILRLKFEVGLFDHPFVDPNAADAALTSDVGLSRQAADESITLLRNTNSVLPLSPNLGKLVVTGPSADSITNQLGGWSVSWQGVFGGGQVCCAGAADQIPPATTVLKGIRQAVSPSTNVVFAPDTQRAVSETATADAAVVVVGESPYAEGLGDNPTPQLAADQQALVAALEQTGRPVIVVVMAGRPLALGPAAAASALLMAYLPGSEGGSAVADLLFGRVNPSGKLSVTWPSGAAVNSVGFNSGGPSTPGDEPKFFDQLPGTNFGPGSGYNPLFPFGFGLSYTSFRTSGLSANGSVSRRGTVTASFTVTNTGGRAGANVVPVFVSQPVSSVLAPPQRLVGFTRVNLDPGQSRTVQVSFPVSELAVTPGDIDASGRPAVPAGDYRVLVGDMSAAFTIR